MRDHALNVLDVSLCDLRGCCEEQLVALTAAHRALTEHRSGHIDVTALRERLQESVAVLQRCCGQMSHGAELLMARSLAGL